MRESRTTRRLALRRKALLGVWLFAAACLFGRAVQVQLFESSEWRERAAAQHRMAEVVPAARGSILDRDGVALAVSRELYRVEVDPVRLTDRDAVRAALEEVLGFSRAKSAELTDPDRTWVTVPGRYEPSVRDRLAALDGVHLTRELRREYPYASLSSGVLGSVQEGVGAGGIEQSFEEILAGRPGRAVFARDNGGRPIPGEAIELESPQSGGDVHLTIDLDLQEIGYQALEEAIEKTRARGGDLIVTDPRTGEILAMVSIHGGSGNGLSVINAPFEPGSTLKPLTAAALLELGRASLDDRFEIGDGTWTINGRTIHDDHADSTVLSLAGVLRESSNVGIAKAAQALTPAEQYEMLRDFGFGVRTGIPLPAEAPGKLYHPDEWSGQSRQSLAYGYELSATPLQLAMAYGALANGGRLLAPRLVSATRSPEGSVRRFAPQVIRRVVQGGVTGQISGVLVDVVEEGTGVEAQLETFSVAGKTGTSRVYSAEIGGYERGRYFGSFVGYFPAEAPQLVIFVKLDSPSEGLYYGGSTAAPVTRATMEAALAARNSPLDRTELLRVRRSSEATTGRAPVTPVRFASRDPATLTPRLVERPEAEWAGPVEVTVPDVSHLSLRDAARALHLRGFRVVFEPSGGEPRTIPEAGARWPVGDSVRVLLGRADP